MPEARLLMQNRYTEHRHHRVADVFLDGPPVSLQGPPHGLEVTGLDVPQGFRVETLSKISRARQVGEHDGDRLSDLLRG